MRLDSWESRTSDILIRGAAPRRLGHANCAAQTWVRFQQHACDSLGKYARFFPLVERPCGGICVCQVEERIRSEVSFIYHWQLCWILQTWKTDCGEWVMLIEMFISKICSCFSSLNSSFFNCVNQETPPTLHQPLGLIGPWTTKVHHAINYANILNPQEAAGCPNKMACITFYLLYMHTSYVLCQILGCLIPPPTFDFCIFNFVEKYNTWKQLTHTDPTPLTHTNTHTPRTHACHPSLI